MTDELLGPDELEAKPPDLVTGRPSAIDPLSAMAPRFNFFLRRFARRYFRHFELDPRAIEKLRELESRGSVVYVMRYSSRLDYFLFNTLFAREGLRLSSFANGIQFHYYRPLFEALRTNILRWRLRTPDKVRDYGRDHARRLALEGQSFFLFLRTARLKSFLRGRRGAHRTDELDLLSDVVRATWDTDRAVFFVPLALFWRKGPRTESRFLNLSYGSLTRPSDIAKVSSFLMNYSGLSVKVGEPIDLQRFVADHREEGADRVARKVRRSILIYLYREEKVVEGPTLRSPYRVQQEVLADPGVHSAILERARERGWTEDRARIQGEKFFREIAANMNTTALAVLNVIVSRIFRKMFASIEVDGIQKVANAVKDHPVVLVPSHRSYFDFLIISIQLYANYMIPPHIAAGDNMGFGPFGYIFRRVGAFFLRRSFDDDLYKEVFRSYIAYLVSEGFIQEFFIEGGRSRTGKSLSPRLGMLSWDVEAFVNSQRRDLILLPVAITYERLVEESSMVGELLGEKKAKESMLGLVRARKFLENRFGTAHVCFGEPISLADSLGDRRERFRDHPGGAPREEDEVKAIEEEKRLFVQDLGWRIVERINWTVVANATSVAASVMMGSTSRGLRREELIVRMQRIVDLLRIQDTRITRALMKDEGEFEESIAFLLRSDLLHSVQDNGGEILYFDESRRQVLDMYRNTIVHYLAAPSFLARRLLAGSRRRELMDDLSLLQDLFYQEFPAPRAEVLALHCDAFIDHFIKSGWLDEIEGVLVASERGIPVFMNFAEQTQSVIDAYRAACDVAATLEDEVTKKEFQARVSKQFECAELLGDARRPESANQTTYSNALDLLVRREVLEAGQREMKPKKGKKKKARKEKRSRKGRAPRMERVFSPTGNAEAIERLAGELAMADLD